MYLPLDLCKQMDIRLIPDSNSWKKVLLRAASEAEDVLAFLWDPECPVLSKDYSGQFQYINNALIAKRKTIYSAMGIDDYEKVVKDKEQDKAFSQESISLFMMTDLWSRHKEVYRFDAELELALTDSEKIELPIRVLDRMPYNTFYIEFAEDGIFSRNFHGAFVSVVKNGTGYTIVAQRLKSDHKSMFGSCCLVPSENCKDAVFVFDRNSATSSNIDRNKDWNEFAFFLINALLYLCALNSEINENDGTKSTYRPTGKIKNKYSEVRKWDCGFRYGETVRLQQKSIKKESENQEIKKISETKERHLPCVHTRKAHWHHYWTGKGRTELILKWIAPTVVGGSKVDVAVIHKMKES